MKFGVGKGTVSRAACLSLLLGCQAQANERVALVMGNAAYEHVPPLANPRSDAEDMAALLARLGFSVTSGVDLTDAAMEDHIREFSRQARAAEVALFFYAGHGMQVDGVNYLVPVDAQLADEADLPFETVALDLVMERMGGGANLVFLDACRDNPFARRWAGTGRSASVGRGLTRVGKTSGSGLFIAFATDPDRVAADGEGRNSPFTAALKRHIETPGLEINALLTEVRKTVLASTSDVQRPWSNSSLSDAFYFIPGTASPATVADMPTLSVDARVLEQETVFWESVKDGGNVSDLEAYLARYPNGAFAPLAANRLQALRGQPFTVVVEPSAARVRILNIEPPYRAGMKLPPGSYRVEASAEGFEPVTKDVAHGSTATVWRVELRRKGRSAGERFRDPLSSGGDGPLMVVVPAGSFRMGSPSHEEGRDEDEGPLRDVTFTAPFAVGVNEVTFAEWDACVAGGGCGGYRPADEGWGRGLRPVIRVSWDDVQQYVQWLSDRTDERYRLPSEAEWEYAARAGTTTPFHTGSTISTDQANYDGNDTYGSGHRGSYRSRTVPVGSFGANGWGLHDMHGNVSEWVEDCWNESYAGAPTDGTPWLQGHCVTRVLRGGSWGNAPGGLRSAGRFRYYSGVRYSSIGFRVARTLTP